MCVWSGKLFYSVVGGIFQSEPVLQVCAAAAHAVCRSVDGRAVRHGSPADGRESVGDLPGTLDVRLNTEPISAPLPASPSVPATGKSTPLQVVLVVLGVVAFLYFARP